MLLQKYKNQNYITKNANFNNKIIEWNDIDYIYFLKQFNSGFYYNKALHIYGQGDTFHDLNIINIHFNQSYNFALKDNLFCFACDLFGNQFCWDGKNVLFFNIESCQIDLISKNFNEWIEIIEGETNYFTGHSILEQWEDLMLPLKFEERLVPIKPFIIGGKYDSSNLSPMNFLESITYNSEIAKQIFNLPDGTEINIKIK